MGRKVREDENDTVNRDQDTEPKRTSLQTFSDRLPVRMESPWAAHQCNKPVTIYEGRFKLTREDCAYNVSGQILLEWLPSPNIMLHVLALDAMNTIDFMQLTAINEWFTLYYDDRKIGMAIQHRMTRGKINELSYLIKNCLDVYTNEKVDEVQFAIPNVRYFFGQNIRNSEHENSASKSRLVFNGTNHTITLDQRRDFRKVAQVTRDAAGFAITHNGLVEFGEPHTYEQVMDLMWKFSVYLTFLTGRRVGTFHIEGFREGKRVFLNYSEPIVKRYTTCKSWPAPHDITGLPELWKTIYTKCQSEEEWDVFRTIIHMYADSNTGPSLETSLILNQTIIELMYNYYIAEQTMDSDMMERAYWNTVVKKMKALIKRSTYKGRLMKGFPELEGYLRQKGLHNLRLYVDVRNALVHSKKNSRSRYNAIPYRVKVQLRDFGLLFIETSLLSIYDVSPKIKARKTGGWVGDDDCLS